MFDRGKQGYIMATQIGQIMHAMEQDFDEKQLRKLIRKFDADGSGKLEFDEFCALVYTEIADDLSDDQLEAAVDEIDEDGSGKIEFEEFWELMAGEAD
uniref:EF-hand domain-containing protein n=1 Tax=Parascaris equorum TaxID=6256 RepID=A0A914S3N5_PAREQ